VRICGGGVEESSPPLGLTLNTIGVQMSTIPLDDGSIDQFLHYHRRTRQSCPCSCGFTLGIFWFDSYSHCIEECRVPHSRTV
jgi:hypothetical protein